MRRQARVVIADDQSSTRSGLRAVLALSPRVKVLGEAADGQEALCLVAEHHPDVVVLDVRMPRMDGLEAARRIKSRWPGIRVVILTMHASYRSKAVIAGADDFLVKGCRSEALHEAILASIDPSYARTERQPASEDLSGCIEALDILGARSTECRE